PFKHTPTTHTYTLSLHDALPISQSESDETPRSQNHRAANRLGKVDDDVRQHSVDKEPRQRPACPNWSLPGWIGRRCTLHRRVLRDRKSTRLNSSHVAISYAVFCL